MGKTFKAKMIWIIIVTIVVALFCVVYFVVCGNTTPTSDGDKPGINIGDNTDDSNNGDNGNSENGDNSSGGDNLYDPPTHTHNYQWIDNNDGTHKLHCAVLGCDMPYIDSETHIWGANNKCEKCPAIKPADEHTHSWSQSWAISVTHHWHNCTANGCTITIDAQKEGYAEHDFSSGNCVCGKIKPIENHTHIWSKTWATNSTHHWHNCTANGCTITDNAQKDGYYEHTPSSAATETTAQVCTKCGYVLVEPLGHTHSVKFVPAVSPKCTENGNIAYYICNCGKTFSDVSASTEINSDSVILNKLNHDIESHSAKSATCTEVGWDAYQTCSRCNYSTKIETAVDPNNHDIVQHEAQIATCIEKGWDAYIACSRCNYNTKVETEIDPNNHDMVQHEAQIATCIEKGWDAYIACSRCDYSKKVETAIDPNNHNTVQHEAKVATCIEKGWNAYETCSRCNYNTKIETEIDPNNHDTVQHEAQIATCIEKGWNAYVTCSRCNYNTKIETEIDPNNHDTVQHEAQVATCVEKGWNAYVTCSRCNYTTKNVFFAEHSYDDYICDVCLTIDPNAPITAGLDYVEIKANEQVIGYSVSKGTAGDHRYIKIPSEHNGKPVTNIGDNAFAGCKRLTIITIPNGITSIGKSAFGGCKSLISVTIPDGVTSIGGSAFEGCESLTSMEIPSSVTSIKEMISYGCRSLSSLTVASGNNKYHSAGNCIIETARKTLIAGCKNSVIPADGSVVRIGYAAFGNVGLTSITIPNTVWGLDYAAFTANDFTSITIPSSVTMIDYLVFSACHNLSSITVASGNSKYRSVGNCIIETASKALITGCNNSVIPADGSVTEIRPFAFHNVLTVVTSITIPSSVTCFGENAFAYCLSLTSIIFQGTKAQWNAISKGPSWDYSTGDYTVTCTDGTLIKSES